MVRKLAAPNAKSFFQDGVGVGTRSPEEAAQIYGTLKEQFGEDRVVIILEAFRLKKMEHSELPILGKSVNSLKPIPTANLHF